MIIQACLGSLYAWATFVVPLTEIYGLSNAQVQIVFGGVITVFTSTMIIAGRLLNSLGPRKLTLISGVLFAAGYILASFSGGSFITMLLGITLITGLGTGCGYVVPLAVCSKWFPRDKGLVTGVAVAGFGGGAVVLALVSKALLHQGTDIHTIFLWMGIVYGAVIILSSLVMCTPVPLQRSHIRRPMMLAAIGRDPSFWAFVLGIFCGTFSGLLVIGVLSPMAEESGLTIAMAGLSVSIFAVGNAAGRILWGYMVDRLRGPVMTYNMVFLGLSLLLFLPAMTFGWTIIFLLASLLTGFGYGGCFVIYAAQTAMRYSIDRVASVYPLIFLAYGASGVAGPMAGGAIRDSLGTYTPGIVLSIAVVIVGMLGSKALMRLGRNRRNYCPLPPAGKR